MARRAAALRQAGVELAGVRIAMARAAIARPRHVEAGEAHLHRPIPAPELAPGRARGMPPLAWRPSGGRARRRPRGAPPRAGTSSRSWSSASKRAGIQPSSAWQRVAGALRRRGRRRRLQGRRERLELPQVRVGVAVGAAAEREALEPRLRARGRAVAGLAAHRRVRAAERVARLLVEGALAHRAAHLPPVRRRVTARRRPSPKPPLVRVLVAVGAGLEREPLVADEGRARHGRGLTGRGGGGAGSGSLRWHFAHATRRVLALERVRRARVVEARRRLPAVLRRGSAGTPRRAGRGARRSGTPRTRVGAPSRVSRSGCLPRTSRTAGSRTRRRSWQRAHSTRRCLPAELEPGPRVVEALLPRPAPVDDREVAPLVLVVARLAGALRGRDPAVEPSPLPTRGRGAPCGRRGSARGRAARPATWHFVQFPSPSSARCARESSPGENTSGARAAGAPASAARAARTSAAAARAWEVICGAGRSRGRARARCERRSRGRGRPPARRGRPASRGGAASASRRTGSASAVARGGRPPRWSSRKRRRSSNRPRSASEPEPHDERLERHPQEEERERGGLHRRGDAVHERRAPGRPPRARSGPRSSRSRSNRASRSASSTALPPSDGTAP